MYHILHFCLFFTLMFIFYINVHIFLHIIRLQPRPTTSAPSAPHVKSPACGNSELQLATREAFDTCPQTCLYVPAHTCTSAHLARGRFKFELATCEVFDVQHQSFIFLVSETSRVGGTGLKLPHARLLTHVSQPRARPLATRLAVGNSSGRWIHNGPRCPRRLRRL